MIEIGGKPILWHIMKIYSHYGINDFIICLGYKGYIIKEYFANYYRHMSDITFDIKNNKMEVHEEHAEPWRVTLVDTGGDTMTGGRLKRVRKYIGNQTFCFTYGDGVADINIHKLLDHHKKSGKKATVTAIQPPGRYGVLRMTPQGIVDGFSEKPTVEGSWINGGYFVLEPSVIDHIDGDETFWELDPLQRLVAEKELTAYQHQGFWQPMDTLREKNLLEDMWNKGTAPWKTWA